MLEEIWEEREFELTSKHISEGLKGDPQLCMLALAIKDVFPNVHNVLVGRKVEIFLEWNKSVFLSMPERTLMLRMSFDMRQTIEPCSFKLIGDFSFLDGKSK